MRFVFAVIFFVVVTCQLNSARADTCDPPVYSAISEGLNGLRSANYIRLQDQVAYDQIITRTCKIVAPDGSHDKDKLLLSIHFNIHLATANRLVTLSDDSLRRILPLYKAVIQNTATSLPSGCSMLAGFDVAPFEEKSDNSDYLRSWNAFYSAIWLNGDVDRDAEVMTTEEAEAFLDDINYTLEGLSPSAMRLLSDMDQLGFASEFPACILAFLRTEKILDGGRVDVFRAKVFDSITLFESLHNDFVDE